MAASAPRGGERMIHQDYIARIRYSNTLPPPPNPPKLLDIPNTGLSSGQYTVPGFASRLARDQALNVEADAELGMPLDLVGMPGIFDGDESSIQAPLHPPVPHPHDRALLRPLASLGKPKSADSGVSFLRRTEYISSHTTKSRMDPATARTLIISTGSRVKVAPKKVDKESPEYIREQVERSFHTAALNLKDANRIKHPSKRNVKLVESFPVLPDLNAFPDAGGYVSVKFQTNPVPPSNVYDKRLEAGVLRPLTASDEKLKARDDAMAAHERDPNRNPYPEVDQDYEFFLLDNSADTANFKRKYDIMDPDNDDENLYTHMNEQKQRCFRFKRVRAYETASMIGAMETKYEDDIAIAINRVEDNFRQRAAYFYPLIQRATIRPQRKKNIDRQKWGLADQAADEADSVDLIDVTVRDATAREVRERRVWIDSPYHVVEDDMDVVIDHDHEGGEENDVQEQEDMDAQLKRESVNHDDDDDETE